MNYDPRFHRRSIRMRGYNYSRAGAYFITICTHGNKRRFGDIISISPTGKGRPEHGEIDRRHTKFMKSAVAIDGLFADLQNPNTNDPHRVDACMKLNACGQVAYDAWVNLPSRFPNCELGVFQIMPDHMHGIIILKNTASGAEASGAGASARDAHTTADAPAPDVGASLADAPFADGAMKGGTKEGTKGATARVARTIGDIVGAYKSLVFNGCLEVYQSRGERMGKLWHRNYYEHIIRNEESFRRISNYIINNPGKWITKNPRIR